MLLRAHAALARMALPRLLLPVLLLAVVTASSLLLAWGLTGLVETAYYIPVKPPPGSILITSYSIAPYTSMVSSQLVENRVDGLAETWPVVLALTITHNRPLLVTGLPWIRGQGCTLYISTELAKQLGASNDSLLLLNSVFTGATVPVKTRIVSRSHGLVAITSTECARTLRGFPGDKASVIIVVPRPGARSEVLEKLGLHRASKASRIIYVASRWSRHRAIYQAVESPEQAFLERLGLQRAVIVAFAAAASAMLAGLAYLVPPLALSLLKRETLLLYYIGVPPSTIRRIVALDALASVMLTSTLLYWIQSRIQLLRISLLGYSPPISPDPYTSAATTTIVIIITLYSSLRAKA